MREINQDEAKMVSGGLQMCRPGDGTVDSGDWLHRWIQYVGGGSL